jgi:hypothetical protein
MDRVIAFIDGFNLYFGLKSKGWRRYYWLNPQALALNLLKPGQRLVSTKYFTARITSPSNDAGKQRRQNAVLEAIGTLPGTRIFYGHYLPKVQSCFRCGSTWNAHEEKMTDVMSGASGRVCSVIDSGLPPSSRLSWPRSKRSSMSMVYARSVVFTMGVALV